jgi:acetyl esterase/lipase
MELNYYKSAIPNYIRCLIIMGCVFLSACTSPEVFLPPPTATEEPVKEMTTFDTGNIPYVGKIDIYRLLSINLPEDETGPYPTVVMFHGGGFQSGDKSDLEDFAQKLSKRGFAVVNVNYSYESYPGPVEDVFCALAWIHQKADTYDFDINRIVTFGEDVGGTLASLLGLIQDPSPYLETCPNSPLTESTVVGVISYSGVYLYGADDDYSSTEWVNEFIDHYLRKSEDGYEERMAEASPMTHIQTDAPPFLLVHGGEAEWVKVSHSERFMTALRAAGITVDLIEMENQRHYHDGTQLGDEDLDMIENFIRNLE